MLQYKIYTIRNPNKTHLYQYWDLKYTYKGVFKDKLFYLNTRFKKGEFHNLFHAFWQNYFKWFYKQNFKSGLLNLSLKGFKNYFKKTLKNLTFM